MYTTWNKTTKAKWLKIARDHQKHDRFVQGEWIKSGRKKAGMHRGCFFGCMMQTSNSVLSEASEQMNLPPWIIHVSEKIFEGLSKEEAVLFPLKLLKAIPVDMDTEKMWKDWNYKILMDKEHGQYKYCGDNAECKKAVKLCAALFKKKKITESAESAARSAESAESAESAAWSAAESAAWSAAWSAAESAAWSAAESAARSAESAARSAESAARSARSAARSAESAARSAARSAESAAESAARSAAESAARSAESAARSAARSAESAAEKKHYKWMKDTFLSIVTPLVK